ncbi:MAG: STAS domain-containing protein [Maioricimonas sp. JB049]
MPTTWRIFDLSEQRGVLIVVPKGDAVGFRDTDVDHELQEILSRVEADDGSSVVVDLGGSNYFGSVMIGAINAIGKTARDRGGDMVICNASPEMTAVMSAMKLDEQWEQHGSRSTAVKAVRKKSR